ncbi:TPA: hypothetical protein K8E22_002637 [Enterobacter cloacae]|nr:hypothetical protein [Enterobacter pasteurii]
MKFLSAVISLSLLVPIAVNAAKDHSIELKCEKIKVTIFDKKGAIFIDSMPAVLTSEWLNADDQPMTLVNSYTYSNPIEKMQAMPDIQSIGETRGW